MIKYLSGRVKRTPQDRLSEDRYDYLDVKQAEPNLADPATSPPVPSGAQFQLVAVPGYPGKRYWVPVGGGLIPGAISIFDEGSLVSSASSITQLNFVGAAVTAQVSVQSPSGFPGIAATITVNPVTILDTPPINPRPGELWWESDTGDLYLYYEDADSSQWVTTNTGGRGDPGTDGDKGQKGEVGAQGLSGSEGDKGRKGEKGEVGQKGEKGAVEAQGNKGQKGELGQKGEKGELGQKGEQGIKGEKGELGQKGEQGIKGEKGTEGLVGAQGDKAGLRYQYSHNTGMGDPGGGIFRYNNSSTLGSVSAIAIDATTKEGADVSDYIATWDDSNNDTIKGNIIVKSNVNSDSTYTIFEVTAVTDNTGWLQITVQNPTGSFPSNNEECVINFTRVGNKGDKGEKGEQGIKGEKGEDNSTKGDKGEDNSTKGQKGEVGSTTKGDKGNTGADNSTKGDKGEDNSTKGDKGEVGSTTKGDKGNTGDDNSSKGDKGEPGSDAGNAGTVTVRTDAGAAWHNLIFVDSTTDNQQQILKMDDESSRLQWNPDTETLAHWAGQSVYQRQWSDGGTGNAGQVLTSGGSSSGWTWENVSSLAGGVPSGGIIIWSGAANAIPTGWALCNGSNSTPDLRNRFVIGAGDTYSVGATGGYTDTPIINHNHTYSSSTSSENSHYHYVMYAGGQSYGNNNSGRLMNRAGDDVRAVSSSYGTGNDPRQDAELGAATNAADVGRSSVVGGHAHSFNGTTNSASNSINSGSGRNIPPYYALCYIMKT